MTIDQSFAQVSYSGRRTGYEVRPRGGAIRSALDGQVRLVWRRGDEALQNVRHRRRRLRVREVSDTLEHLEAAARQRVMSGVRVRDGNDPVAISPDQQGGQIGGEVKLV